jgi:hypothetical protein
MRPGPRPNPLKALALRKLRTGEITAAEAALWCAVTRQRIHAMCKAAGFDPVQTRARRLEAMKRKEDRRSRKKRLRTPLTP